MKKFVAILPYVLLPVRGKQPLIGPDEKPLYLEWEPNEFGSNQVNWLLDVCNNFNFRPTGLEIHNRTALKTDRSYVTVIPISLLNHTTQVPLYSNGHYRTTRPQYMLDAIAVALNSAITKYERGDGPARHETGDKK